MPRPMGAGRAAAMTFDQIAHRTGTPRSTVYRIYREGLRKLNWDAIEISRRASRSGSRLDLA
jgi:predicted DNA-binding transcriptional regulator AlpA